MANVKMDGNLVYRVLKADFKLMTSAVENFGTPAPLVVYIRENGIKKTDYVTYGKYQEMKTRWNNYIKDNNDEPQFVWINKPAETPQPEKTTITTTPFPYIYYLRPDMSPNYDLAAMKNVGVTDVFLRVSRVSDRSNYYASILPEVKEKFKSAGINLHAWVNGNLDLNSVQINLNSEAGQSVADEIVSVCGKINDMGIDVHLDLDFGDSDHISSQATEFVRKVREATAGVTFTIAVMPNASGVDSSKEYGQDYTALVPYVDAIVPMLYKGNYNLSYEKMTSAAGSMQGEAPGKLWIALQTYQSDNDTTVLSAGDLNKQIEAVKNSCQGIALFRYGLSNFGSEITVDRPTGPNKPVDITGWVFTGAFDPDKQDTDYTCGPTSLSMVLSALGYPISESELADLAGTTTSGTSHSGLYQAAKSVAKNIKYEEYSLSELGWRGVAEKLEKDCEFIVHIMTGTLPNWQGDWGHYIFLTGVNVEEGLIRVFDPTKGDYTYTFSQLETAINQISQKSLLMFYR